MSWRLGHGSEVYLEVSVGKLASLDDESFWKLGTSQYDDHKFDSFDVDDGFWHKAAQQTANIKDDGKEKSTSRDHCILLNLRQWRICNELLTVQNWQRQETRLTGLYARG